MRGKERGVSAVQEIVRITPAHAGKSLAHGERARFRRDHPRTCGEKNWRPVHVSGVKGSPPHMRGKGCAFTVPGKGQRITPAHAGKRRIRSAKRAGQEDHPRTCGEKCPREASSRPPRGSPPHMRGKDAAVCNEVCDVGITPAHAGKSKRRGRKRGGIWDHPRTCGEKEVELL